MENKIIKLVIAMHNPQTGFALVRQILAVPGHHLIEIGDRPYLLASLDVNGLCLRDGDAGEGFNLAREIVRRGPEVGETDCCRGDGSECGEGTDGGEPAKNGNEKNVVSSCESSGMRGE